MGKSVYVCSMTGTWLTNICIILYLSMDIKTAAHSVCYLNVSILKINTFFELSTRIKIILLTKKFKTMRHLLFKIIFFPLLLFTEILSLTKKTNPWFFNILMFKFHYPMTWQKILFLGKAITGFHEVDLWQCETWFF